MAVCLNTWSFSWDGMLCKIFADIVVLIYFLWIVFLLLGAVWGVKNKVIRVIHFSGLFFAILIQIFNWYCPLTHVEFWLRSKHDPALTYAGSFIVHYVEKLIYFELSQSTIFIFTVFLCAFNAWAYFGRRRWLPYKWSNSRFCPWICLRFHSL